MIPKKSSRILLSVIALAILALTGCNDFFGGNLGFEKETLRGALDQECRQDPNDRCNPGLKCNANNMCEAVATDSDRGKEGKQCREDVNDQCDAGLVCNTADTCEKEKGKENQECRDTNPKCDPGLVCNTAGTCEIEKGKKDQECRDTDPKCDPGLSCDASKVCVITPGTLGGACRTNGDACEGVLVCDSQTDTCQNPGAGTENGVCRAETTNPRCDTGLMCDKQGQDGTCVTCESQGLVWHPKVETCVQACDPSKSCPSGEFCADDYCTKDEDLCKVISCDPGYRCDQPTGQCVVDSCDPSKLCNNKCCGNDQVCYLGQKCVDKTVNGEPFCYVDSDGVAQACPTGQKCVVGTDKGICIDEAKTKGDNCDLNNAEYCPGKLFCEENIQKCVNYEDVKNDLCLSDVNFNYEVEEVLTWKGSTKTGLKNYNQVISLPLAFDGKLIFAAYESDLRKSVLFVIKGVVPDAAHPDQVTELWNSQELGADSFYVDGMTTMALGDIDPDENDGPEIIAQTFNESNTENAGLLAINLKSQTIKWKVDNLKLGDSFGDGVDWALSIADIDGDNNPEIITPFDIREGQGSNGGKVLCKYRDLTKIKDQEISRAPIAVNLDGKGDLEIVGGGYIRTLKRGDENTICPNYNGTTDNDLGRGHKLLAVADLTGDGKAEIVVSNSCVVYVLDDKNTILAQADFPEKAYCGTTWYGGAPTIADFDGDGKVEIGIAGLYRYAVYKYRGLNNLERLWEIKITDGSGKTGSAAFDFNANGHSEIVYNDENTLYFLYGNKKYSASDSLLEAVGHQSVFTKSNFNATLLENPVIVDLNKDGSAEIVVATNQSDKIGKTTGIRVFKEKYNRWSGTRSIWNQHAYNPTFINDDGTVPTKAPQYWKKTWSNNFRKNPITNNIRFVADLRPEFDSLFTKGECDAQNKDTRDISYRIYNDGEKAVPAGKSVTKISIRENGTSTWTEVHSEVESAEIPAHGYIEGTFTLKFTDSTLAPFKGKALDIQIIADANDDIVECRELNNTTEVTNVPVSRGDLTIEILSVDDNMCSEKGNSDKIKVKVKIKNTTPNAIPASTDLDYNIYVQAGPTIQKQRFTVGAEIAATDGTFENEVEITIAEKDFNKLLFVYAILDEKNVVEECQEGGFAQYTAAPVACYKLD